MFATFGRTWELTKQSFAVLRADKEILLFPILSAVAAVIVSLSFIVPLLFSGFLQREEGALLATDYLLLFAFYYANYFVIIFFNSALVACANIRLSGGDPTVADGFRHASARLGRIAAWTLVAATVGLILRILEERAENIGRFVVSLIGLAWNLITYFIIPVIVLEDLSITDSVKRSAGLFRQRWGEQVTSSFGFGLIFFLLAIPGIFVGILALAIHPLVGFGFMMIYFLGLAAIAAAVKGIFNVALYRFATQGEVPAGFSPDLIQNAFAPKPGRW
ncbi:MAG: DUF6159 family protein [Candidatus Acidiferrales bacterium]